MSELLSYKTLVKHLGLSDIIDIIIEYMKNAIFHVDKIMNLLEILDIDSNSLEIGIELDDYIKNFNNLYRNNIFSMDDIIINTNNLTIIIKDNYDYDESDSKGFEFNNNLSISDNIHTLDSSKNSITLNNLLVSIYRIITNFSSYMKIPKGSYIEYINYDPYRNILTFYLYP